MENKRKFTVVGTDIEEVKRQNAASGLSYNEVKEMLARDFLAKNGAGNKQN
ncbi:hypothetical protein [Bacillus sp. T33-2]|uniref:hypothetical protein n=1 Tax=Bacillus sp. T33-2 TaxID=2054168 RepID=UPI000CB92649|nr:hypothetical protein [Bacillus sp. T33-2]PLR98774.1 hypothetical protein CVD19_03810 [Bacillus sp. T33-2]